MRVARRPSEIVPSVLKEPCRTICGSIDLAAPLSFSRPQAYGGRDLARHKRGPCRLTGLLGTGRIAAAKAPIRRPARAELKFAGQRSLRYMYRARGNAHYDLPSWLFNGVLACCAWAVRGEATRGVTQLDGEGGSRRRQGLFPQKLSSH